MIERYQKRFARPDSLSILRRVTNQQLAPDAILQTAFSFWASKVLLIRCVREFA
jgi:hypothetical protein